MKYNIAIVEDNPQFNESLQNYLDKYSQENHTEFKVYSFSDGDEITSDYEAKYDIIFLDIEMKRLDGMSAAQKIREFDSDVIIIFITNMAQYAISGYSVGALSFLLKPLPYFAFSQELTKSIERLRKRKQKSILIPTENAMIKINSQDILYVESYGHDIIVYTQTESYTTRGTIKRIEEDLADFHFYRCNNGYLVNLAYVSGVKDEEAIVGKYRLKISRPRKKSFMEALTQYIGGTL
ncbi:MAG TPA: DNA-binding response regulator [Acholeplasmataceae bacterium]|nr:MAG: DNA-binding response regulator [Tenericutes bacterium GWD2_38_27]OHE39884.1 MAG: DNA-binding response regulator [Tenericutes bacterium GWE2_38_8]HBG32236.1 DNA-binding response regulator [Acholeplasmataceae bacterium]HBY65241.1 DNA-binding response regulator [Acholeplasmataceae bacterium]HCB66490.1 DNA-binding response regulator [Acholeplasmataceae bacterium]